MFDIGFSELCLVALVALLVIGPERLPRVARVTGMWLGKMRRMAASVRAEISQELRAEELRQILKEQAELEEARQMLEETSRDARRLIEAGEDLSLSSPSKPRSAEPTERGRHE